MDRAGDSIPGGNVARAGAQYLDKTENSFLEDVGTWIVAHRGASRHRPENTLAAYALLSLLPAEQTELGFDVTMGLEDTFSNWREHYREAGYPESLSLFATGPEVVPVDGGLFDVDGIPVISEE